MSQTGPTLPDAVTILSQFYKHVLMCETDSEAVVGCEAAASALYLHFASRLCSANTTLFLILGFDGHFPWFSLVFRTFCFLKEKLIQKIDTTGACLVFILSVDLIGCFSKGAAPSLFVTAREM